MTDATIDPVTAPTGNSEIPVNTDSLSIDGTAPSVGDHVEFTVGATVTKVLNGTAYCSPESVNGSAIEQSAPDASGDEPDLGKMAMAADSQNSY